MLTCSHVIQTQAQKCDGMHINFDAVYQGDSKFAHETSKTQTALIGSIFSDERTRHFDALMQCKVNICIYVTVQCCGDSFFNGYFFFKIRFEIWPELFKSGFVLAQDLK